VVLESDSSILVSAIKSSTEDRSIITGIWRDIRELCRLFISFEVNFVRREANSLADRCAKEVSVDSPVRDWYDWLLEAAANDCNLLDVNCMKLPILKKKRKSVKQGTSRKCRQRTRGVLLGCCTGGSMN
jgi:hypothetical protein